LQRRWMQKWKVNREALHTVVIKDNIDTADKMQTTAGSLALKEILLPKMLCSRET
jgi:Asp-tRNA(Asn)/Glu-tRNA(Gln) amidotransferase A subunit family amidase